MLVVDVSSSLSLKYKHQTRGHNLITHINILCVCVCHLSPLCPQRCLFSRSAVFHELQPHSLFPCRASASVFLTLQSEIGPSQSLFKGISRHSLKTCIFYTCHFCSLSALISLNKLIVKISGKAEVFVRLFPLSAP